LLSENVGDRVCSLLYVLEWHLVRHRKGNNMRYNTVIDVKKFPIQHYILYEGSQSNFVDGILAVYVEVKY